jgi:hypothetical protein
MLTRIFGSAVFGIDAQQITIEVHIHPGVGYHLVGLPDNAVKESNYRIAVAVLECGLMLHAKRIKINIAVLLYVSGSLLHESDKPNALPICHMFITMRR